MGLKITFVAEEEDLYLLASVVFDLFDPIFQVLETFFSYWGDVYLVIS